jgi:hypothetical protein
MAPLLRQLVIKLTALYQALKAKQSMTPDATTPDVTVQTAQNFGQHIYQIAYAHIGEHLGLDPSVPNMFDCAETVSEILKLSGYYMPSRGLASVDDLVAFLAASKAFKEVSAPELGCVIAHSSGEQGTPNARRHVGIGGKTYVMSNDSFSGHFLANYSYEGWKSYFEVSNGVPSRYFVAIL